MLLLDFSRNRRCDDAAINAKNVKNSDTNARHAACEQTSGTDPKLRAAPSGHMVNIREVRLAAGAEFVVMICGDIMTMPGLPKEPASMRIDIDDDDDDGKISGLF